MPTQNKRALKALSNLGESITQATQATDPESALTIINTALAASLGNPEAHKAMGALKDGERQQFACGSFFLSSDGKENVLIAPVNYPPEQRHMRIDSTLGHPGWMVKNKRCLLLTNTDQNSNFVRILQTFRAGSVVYAPIMLGDKYFGQIICAAQARNTMEEIDLRLAETAANACAVIWESLGGEQYLASLPLSSTN